MSSFLYDRESTLPGMKVERLYFGVDRQDHFISWSRRMDKRNVTLSSVAATDNATGCVFGMMFNFDPAQIESLHLSLGYDMVPAVTADLRACGCPPISILCAQSKCFIGNGALGSAIGATYATNTS